MKILEEILAFNSKLGCTPQEGYRDLDDALSDTKRLSIEGAVPTVNLVATNKQARAGVLAAVHSEIEIVEKLITDNRNLGAYDELVDRLTNLQPAASDLKELLREAELRGRIAQLNMMKGDDAGGMWFPDPGAQTINDRVAELEKARASEGKG